MVVLAIFKIRKAAISPQHQQFLQNLAQWCDWPSAHPSVNKISGIWKSKMVVAAILKSRKTAISPQWSDQFLPRDAMLSAVYAVIMCLSVCVSVTLRYCIKTAKCRITQIIPHDSPWNLVFWHQSSRQNLNLSLIHIWRCRRSTLCRSRWSPYH